LVVGASFWIWRAESLEVETRHALPAQISDGEVAREELLAAPAEHELATADGRVAVESGSPHRIRSDEPWIHSAPDLPLTRMKGREILEAYWGERWPEVSAYLGERVSIVDTYWAAEGDELGQPEDALDGMVEDILDDLDGGGGRPRRIGLMCSADPLPHGPSAAYATVLDTARRLRGGSLAERQRLELTLVQQMPYLNEIAAVIRELDPTWLELDAAVRRLVVEQLTGLDRFTQPELGHLTLNPLFNFGSPPDVAAVITAEGGRSRWFVGFTARAVDRVKCKFVAQWCVDLRLDPRCAAAIEAIVAHEETIAARLEEIAQRMALELE